MWFSFERYSREFNSLFVGYSREVGLLAETIKIQGDLRRLHTVERYAQN